MFYLAFLGSRLRGSDRKFGGLADAYLISPALLHAHLPLP